ncbi:glycosyltransferase family 4 protein [Fictibacillus barbaricus]|uniref:UDP-GlcNAc:undecaprenyl-phosphate GlcNAc-1-phosphate transferase n=1 Tax=Fictibacillus barbaricus TaxID=182136 RepID=A0ABU1U149_9BACL|nr:MraY family glycosyltransferase [Fictibacillus barbaricus]MDR7073167.1 UDP-GlcNAc:undecaprenyl-phosphate GlcNAc-1-phosphate transferase [Fictibacillus barbaricus]
MKTLLLTSFISFLTVLLVTPFVIKLAILIGVTDKPDKRKVHQKVMPRLGGLAIVIGVVAGYFTAGLQYQAVSGITLGGIIIVIVGLLDDKLTISPKMKLLGQLLAALVIVGTGLTIDFISIPFVGKFDLGIWAYPITIFWILAITNAINLIDGLDGLAGGISAIVISTIAIMAGLNGNMMILTLSLIVLSSTIGFLFFNFHPAKIFMGDTGALFLGYCISVLSLLGLYKSVTLFSFVVPIIILGVPVFDTTFAIIRRLANKQPISAPDKGHLHHRLLQLGLSHRNTVLLIYGLSIIFSFAAAIFSSTTVWGAIAITAGLLVLLELIAELIGLVHYKYRPLLFIWKKVFNSNSTQQIKIEK